MAWSFASDESFPIDEPIAIEFVEIGDLPSVTERPEPSLAAAPRETIDALDTPEPEPIDSEIDLSPPEPLAELPPVESEPTQPEPEPEPAPARKQELQAPVDRNVAEAPEAREEEDFAKLITDALPTRAQLSSVQQATLAGAIRERVYKCWDPNAGGPDADKIVTTLRVKAAKSGEIVGRPSLVRQTGNAATGYKRAARDAAIRAVMNPACSLEGLPADLYEGGWEDFTLNFDPKDF
ncbi:MAG: hypothetical protein WA906_10715 [Pacificimonas sp.]